MRKENRGSTRKGDFANTWKRKKSWKPCNYLLWGSIPGKAIMSFLFMIFILFHSYFHLLFWALLCWLVDIKDHSFALSGRTLYMYAQFWFILDFFFLFSLVNIRCTTPSLNLIRQNDALVSFGFHVLLWAKFILCFYVFFFFLFVSYSVSWWWWDDIINDQAIGTRGVRLWGKWT